MAQKIDMQKVEKWLNDKWKGNRTCSICQGNNWKVGDKVVELREVQQGGFVLSVKVYPVISVTCKDCGNTLLINALVADLLGSGS